MVVSMSLPLNDTIYLALISLSPLMSSVTLLFKTYDLQVQIARLAMQANHF